VHDAGVSVIPSGSGVVVKTCMPCSLVMIGTL
jgi:hypothetical protein